MATLRRERYSLLSTINSSAQLTISNRKHSLFQGHTTAVQYLPDEFLRQREIFVAQVMFARRRRLVRRVNKPLYLQTCATTKNVA